MANTNTNTNINTNIIPNNTIVNPMMNNYNLNPGYYNNLLDNTIQSALIAIITGKTLNIDKKTLIIIILLSSLPDIKEFIKNVLKYFREHGIINLKNFVCETFNKFKSFITNKIVFLITELNYKKTVINYNSQPLVHDNILRTKIIINEISIIDAIISYIDYNEKTVGHYISKLDYMNIKNICEIIENVIISDLTLNIDDNTTIFFSDEINISYLCTNNKKQLLQCNTINEIDTIEPEILNPSKMELVNSKIKLSTINPLLNNNCVINALKEIYALLPLASIPQYFDYNINYEYIKNINFVLNNKFHITYYILRHIYNIYYVPQDSIVIIHAALLILYHYCRNSMKITKNSVHFTNINCTMLIDSINIDLTKLNETVCTFESNSFFNHHLGGHRQINKLDEIFKPLIEKYKKNNNIINNSTNLELSIAIHHKLNNNVDDKILINKFYNFLNKDIIKQYSERKAEIHNVSVFLVRVIENVEEKEVENPEYKTYEQKKELLNLTKNISDKPLPDNIASDSTAYDSNLIIGLGLHMIPSKTIVKQIITHVISCDKKGEVNKSLDTLYLREQDIKQLQSILYDFKHCSDMYKEFGITKKIGIMLYGVPGTGKSSTIIAIATYLNYDIYYVSLNGVKKNSDIDLIFDYVMKNCSKRGMIVFEDIDAQTNIVHKRNVNDNDCEENKMSMYNLNDIKDDNLDLSYLLNRLDGTLSQQETVFAMTTNHIDMLDPAIYRKGRINALIHLKMCNRYQIATIFEKIIKRKINSDILNRIEEDKYTPAEIIQHLIQMRLSNITDYDIMKNFIL
jgi:ATP-dependent 26S proteasome regulatory subunit